MSDNLSKRDEFNSMEPVIPLPVALMTLGAVAIGTASAAIALTAWLPGLSQSVGGTNPTAFWYLARSGGVVAYVLLWMSIAFGLIITNKFARVWPGGPTAMDLHQFTALLGFAFAIFHGLILMGDQYIKYSLLQLLIPFASVNYQPLWVGLGQIAFYLMIPVTFSFYFRKRLGYAMWRSLHYGSFVVYALITVHGLLAGSDSTNPAMLALYAVTGALVYFFTLYRIFTLRHASPAAS